MPPKKASKKKSSVLSRAQPVGELDSNLLMLVYGKADTGKTEFASTWPGPVLFIGFNERGTDTVKDKPDTDIVELQTFEEFDELYWDLKDGSKYKTLVLDQITSLQGFGIDYIRRKMKKKPGEVFSQKNWGQLSGEMRTGIENYRNMVDQYNICFLAHERTFNASSDEEDEGVLDPFIGAAIMPSINTFTTGAVSAIGNTFIKEEWRKLKGGKEERIVKFCMRTGPSGYYFTKIRRPVKAGPVPEYIVNPTYAKIKSLIDGKSPVKPAKRK